MRRDDAINLAALAAVQVSNALIPLLVFPYALAVVGSESYARLAVTEVFMIAALSVVLYSFEVDGVSRVVRLNWRLEKDALSVIYSTVLWARLILFSGCLAIACIARPFIDPVISDLLLAWLAVPLSYVLQANWLYQAIERNVFVAAVTVASRIGAAILVVFLVKTSDDVLKIPAILGTCYLVAAMMTVIHTRSALGVRLRLTPTVQIVDSLRFGWRVFVGSLAVTMYRDLNVVILAAVQGNAAAVAAYSIAEKLVKGLQATMRPLNQIYFPKTLRKLGDGRKANRRSLSDVLEHVYPQWTALTSVIIVASLVFFMGRDYLQAVDQLPLQTGQIAALVFLMIPATYFGVANFMLGTVGLNYMGERAYLYRSILVVGATSVAVSATLSTTFYATGTALGFVLAEAMLAFAIVIRYHRNVC